MSVAQRVDHLGGVEPALGVEQRLRAVAPLLLTGGAHPDEPAGSLLARLVQACHRSGDREHLWALLTGLAGAMPREAELRTVARSLELDGLRASTTRLLDVAFELAADTEASFQLDVVRDTVIADVDFCARRDFHTGIQRVVRETVPRWAEQHEILPVAWTDTSTCARRLHEWEVPNVMAYRAGAATVQRAADRGSTRLVLPVGCTVVLPEIPEPEASDCYAAMASWSSNRVVAIGYDMIPLVSADLRPGFEATRFTRYLNVVKHADTIAAISRSATAEFTGFAQALEAQGLPGPRVVEVLLPAATPDRAAIDASADAPPRAGRPVVVCVGTHDPHKNHAVTVHAAERLWREGLDFELVFIGGVGFRGPEQLCYLQAQAAGRPVRSLGRATDEVMAATLRSADFTVFLSLHEGYGLPVAESLACGTPVITSAFGSLQEIAEPGGCLTVDPRDDDAVTAAMRTLLTRPEELSRLRHAIAARPERTWDMYAEELWTVAVEDAR